MSNTNSGFPGAGTLPPDSANFYSLANAMWPGLQSGQALVSPPRNGMDRYTGALLQGWDHVDQSLEILFSTPFHQRVLRRWVGSFVPHILGESAVARIITRFFWAIVTAVDLWEPDYRINQTYLMGQAISDGSYQPQTVSDVNQLLRTGQLIFRIEGTYYPRGHLGDFTPYEQKASGIINDGANLWKVIPLTEVSGA